MAKSNIADKFRMLGPNQKDDLERLGYYTKSTGEQVHATDEEHRAFVESRKKNKGRMIPKNKNLSGDSSQDEKGEAAEAIYELLSDIFFDKISFISFPFTKTAQIYHVMTDAINLATSNQKFLWSDEQWTDSKAYDDGLSLSITNYIHPLEGPVTDTVRYWGISRIPNTSEGKFLSADRKSRMRCSFYLENSKQVDGYILSPVSYDSFAQLNYFTSMDIFRAYVGLKFYAGNAYAVIKEAGKDEVTTPIDIDVSFDTFRLDIISNGKETSILVDNLLIGNFPSDFTTGFEGINQTFLPLLSPARSLNGTEVGITIENYQFIQDN